MKRFVPNSCGAFWICYLVPILWLYWSLASSMFSQGAT